MQSFRTLGRLPREIWILAAVTLVNRMGTMALPFLVLYLTRHLGFAAPVAGAVLGLYGVTALFASLMGGRLSDRLGPRRVMVGSLLTSGLLLALFPLAKSLPAVMAMTAGWALASDAFRPAALTAIADLAPADQRKPAFALLRMAINLGMSVGPALGGFLATVSFPSLFLVDGATALAAGVLLLASPWRETPAARDGRPRGLGGLADPLLMFFLVSSLPVCVVFFQHEAAMPLFMVRDLHLTESTYGLMFTLNTVLIVALEVPLNASMAEWPHRRTLVLGALLCGAGFGGLLFAHGAAGVSITVVIWTFGEMVLLPGMNAYVSEIAPPERRGDYMGLYTMAFSLSFAIGPWLGTTVLDQWGAAAVWSGCFALASVSALLYSRLVVATSGSPG